jgi:HD-GYP domain-containing protein (c-di-GMP phosphodiesterase class II)
MNYAAPDDTRHAAPLASPPGALEPQEPEVLDLTKAQEPLPTAIPYKRAQVFLQSMGVSAADPDSKDGKDAGEDPGATLALLLLRLPQLIRLHQPNNKILLDNLELARATLKTLWQTNTTISIRLHRGRLYLNERRLPSTQTITVASARLVELFGARKIFGLRFYKHDELDNYEVVELINDFNSCILQSDPRDWLMSRRDGSWATPIIDKDFKISIFVSEDGTGQHKALVWNSGVNTLAIKAKQSYAKAIAAITGLNERLTEGQSVNVSKPKRVIQEIVEGLYQNENMLLNLSTIRNYDDYTCTHCVNVAILSICLGKRLGLGKVQLMHLGLSALFHDLGKVDIPIDLIHKPGKLTDEEYVTVKNHSIYSVIRILRINADHTLKTRLIIPPFEHHLGVDLTGYPLTERRSPLSLFGRIVAIADHYDALTSARAYRPIPTSPEQALNVMLQCAGAALDPLLLKVFINMIGVYPVGTLLLLDSREVAIVAETPYGAKDARPLCYLLVFENDEIIRGEMIDLCERGEKGDYARNILRCYNPTEFGLNPSDILC